MDMPLCTRCGRKCYPVNVTTQEDPEPVFVPGCNCDPRWPHDPITPERERELIYGS